MGEEGSNMLESLNVIEEKLFSSSSAKRSKLLWAGDIWAADQNLLRNQHRLKRGYLQWLCDNGLETSAAEIHEQNGDLVSSLNLYLKAGLLDKAAGVVTRNPELYKDEELVGQVVFALEENCDYSTIAEIYYVKGQLKALVDEAAKKKDFAAAVNLAKEYFPSRVEELEFQWGNHLMSCHKPKTALPHYETAGKVYHTLAAALGSQQWKKAGSIFRSLAENTSNSEQFQRLACYFFPEDTDSPVKKEAYSSNEEVLEELLDVFFKADECGLVKEFGASFVAAEKMHEMLLRKGGDLENSSSPDDAEKLYVSCDLIDDALEMRRRFKQYADVIRLVKAHRPDQLREAHMELAAIVLQDGDKEACEYHLIAAGDWKAAVEMYREADQWEEAFRVVRTHGSEKETYDFALEWNSILEGEDRGLSSRDTYFCDDTQESFQEIVVGTNQCIVEISIQEDDLKEVGQGSGDHLERPFQCGTCKRQFTRKYHLDRHARQTGCEGTPKTSFPCGICGKYFSRKDNLNQHLRAHAGHVIRRPKYACEICGKEISGKTLLRIHLRTHYGERPYKCNHCGKCFVSSYALLRHTKTHKLGDT